MGNAPKQLHDAGQSLWLDYITREIVENGTLERYIDELSLTGLTSNPTIFDKALSGGDHYDEQIGQLLAEGKEGEELFFELAITDLQGAADLFRGVHDETDGVDGFVSLEVSPELAYHGNETAEAAARLSAQADRPNIYIKIPGTPQGLAAITESIAAGIPINVTLLFDADQYRAQADAYMRGIEQRIERGDDPAVASVASIFVSRWDVAVAGKVPAELANRLGVAIGQRTYKAYREMLASSRFQRAANAGARAQRLLWASTGTKDPKASDILYVKALASPFTVNTMPEGTLKAFADHGEVAGEMAPDGGDCETVLASFGKAGIDVGALAKRLQDEGAASFVKSWNDLMGAIESKSTAMRKAS